MKYLAITLLLTVLCGCATQPTKFVQSDGPGHYGWHDSQLGPTRYRVSFAGNTNTGRDRVKDFALKRAAQLTLKQGHDWFRVVNQNTEHDTEHAPTETTSMSTPPEVTRSCGLLGCTTSVAPGYAGVSVTTSHTSNKYVSSIEIVMGDGKPADPTTVYNARELLKFLDKKYQ